MASEEFYIDKDNFGMLEGYLKGCIQDRFVPWVYVERGGEGGKINA